VAKANETLLVSPSVDNGEFSLRATYDGDDNGPYSVSWKLIDFKGKELKAGIQKGANGTDKPEILLSEKLETFLAGADTASVVLVYNVNSGPSQTFYFCWPRQLKLPTPTLDIQRKGDYLEVRTDVVCPGFMAMPENQTEPIQTIDPEAFSDLLPGQVRRLHIPASAGPVRYFYQQNSYTK
jgi:hypothetical protein